MKTFFQICLACLSLSGFGFLAAAETGKIGERPYEMVWADRTSDDHVPLVDFENLDGWTVETAFSDATFARSREQQLWGDYVGHLSYKAGYLESDPNFADKLAKESVFVRAPEPIAIPRPFDCVNFWICGNNWEWMPDPSTPKTGINIVLLDSAGSRQRFPLGAVNWKEWWLMHHKFSPEQLAALGDSPRFEGFEVVRGSNQEFRELYFDNLSFFKEELKPLEYEPRPRRGIELPEGQTLGNNIGPDRLPFPNREETILPTNLSQSFRNEIEILRQETEKSASPSASAGSTALLKYVGNDGTLVWTYAPRTGTLGDLTVGWTDPNGKTTTFRPNVDGELLFENDDDSETAARLLELRQEEDTVLAKWEKGKFEYLFRFRPLQKSLLIDIACRGGAVRNVSLGHVEGAPNPRIFPIPYLTGHHANRPSTLVMGPAEEPLFFLQLVDHTRSNASELFFTSKIEGEQVATNGGSRYLPKTDGTYNDCFERIFLTVAPKFEEVLPNIPNEESPWKSVTGERVWFAFPASNHESDYNFWKKVRRYGLEKMLITDHETLWRDGGESFTFRTRAAPGKGGDEGQREYTCKMHELGYYYGPYNNYTDYSPTNEYWNEDWLTRKADGNWRNAWARCYNAKPAIVVQVEPKITEIIQKKFGFNTAYCDVHTAVFPWSYVDYDARVPGAGTFGATFYSYGEILLHQRKIWGGPVYSEGNNHWYYCGIVDGNYAQDQSYRFPENPWLVDFDLLKIHPRCCNFGMGNPEMFYKQVPKTQTPLERDAVLDRFLAATLAFGHTGFFALEFGLPGAFRSYFVLQQLHQRYASQSVRDIQYADAKGNLFPSSLAIANEAFRENRIRVEYEDGLTIFVNGNAKASWSCPEIKQSLPPNGWYVLDPKKEITAQSLVIDRLTPEPHRSDYVDSPRYLFADARGKLIRFDRLLCDGQLIVLKNADSPWEVIPGIQGDRGSTNFAVRLEEDRDATAVGLDFDGREIGPARTRYSRGFVHIEPLKDAVSYLLTPKPQSQETAAVLPRSDRTIAVPGEAVPVIIGEKETRLPIPEDAKVNTVYWVETEAGPIDFEIKNLCDVRVDWHDVSKSLSYSLRCNRQEETTLFTSVYQGDRVIESSVRTESPNGRSSTGAKTIPHEQPQTEPICLKIVARLDGNETTQELFFQLKTEEKIRVFDPIPNRFENGFCFRGGTPEPLDEKNGAEAYPDEPFCGNRKQPGWSVHPPYIGGTGYTFLLSEPIVVPNEKDVVFSAEVGIRNGGAKSDGILYKVLIVEGNDETKAAELWCTKNDWQEIRADLTPWAGKTIRLRLIADVGPADDSNADWAAWGKMQLRSDKPELMTTLE